jgi:16S rRNA (uracil1498-N3)-methyltransferase
VTVLDGRGREWAARLAATAPRGAVADLDEEHAPEPPALFRVTLAQVVPRGAAMDLIVGKATELGVSRIIPLKGERSVRRLGSGATARWQRLLTEATEQSGRRWAPDLAEPCTLDEFLRNRPRDCPILACDSDEGAVPLAAACRSLVGAGSATVMVGGEGGLSLDEVDRVRAAGGLLVTLGPRLLRAETAALAALAVLQAFLGDWTGPAAAPMTGGTDVERPHRG